MYYIVIIRKASLCALPCFGAYTIFQALSTLLGRTTKGYYACIYCDKNPLSRSLRKKLGYLGHRHYLPRDHPWRKSLDFDGETEDRDAPKKFTLQEVLEELETVKYVCPSKHGEKGNESVENG